MLILTRLSYRYLQTVFVIALRICLILFDTKNISSTEGIRHYRDIKFLNKHVKKKKKGIIKILMHILGYKLSYVRFNY